MGGMAMPKPECYLFVGRWDTNAVTKSWLQTLNLCMGADTVSASRQRSACFHFLRCYVKARDITLRSPLLHYTRDFSSPSVSSYKLSLGHDQANFSIVLQTLECLQGVMKHNVVDGMAMAQSSSIKNPTSQRVLFIFCCSAPIPICSTGWQGDRL